MRALALLASLVPVIACGGSDAECVIDTDCPLFDRCSAQLCVPVGTSDASMDSGVPRDSSADTTVADTAVDSGPTIIGRGNAGVIQTPIAPMMNGYSLSATFARTDGAPPACTTTEGTPCIVTECITAPPMDAGVPPDGGMMDAGPPTAPNAGQIDIGGGMVDLMVTPSVDDGLYPPATGTGFVYAGGETLNVTAAGADVPAFTESITAPYPVVLTAPLISAGMLSIDRSMDFDITWTTAEPAPGNVVVILTGSEVPMAGGSRSVTLTCVFDGAGVSATIDTADLANLPGGGAMGSFSVSTGAATEIMSGEWAVTLYMINGATGDTGGAATTTTIYP